MHCSYPTSARLSWRRPGAAPEAPLTSSRQPDRAASPSRDGLLSIILSAAPRWWWKARPLQNLAAEAATVLVIGLTLNLFGIGLFCWLIYTLAVYALPFFVGLSAGIAALHGGAGVPGALVAGVGAGALILVIGQIAFAIARPLILRAIIAAAFAIPAAIAGYHAVLGLSQIAVPSPIWRDISAWVGALLIGGTGWARMAVLVPRGSGGYQFGLKGYSLECLTTTRMRR